MCEARRKVGSVRLLVRQGQQLLGETAAPLVRLNASTTAHGNHQLAIVRRPHADVFGAHPQQHILGKLTSIARETPSSSLNVKTPSSLVFLTLSFNSLLIAMAHLRGHCCVRRSHRGVPFSHSP